jgi:hypothetical protein
MVKKSAKNPRRLKSRKGSKKILKVQRGGVCSGADYNEAYGVAAAAAGGAVTPYESNTSASPVAQSGGSQCQAAGQFGGRRKKAGSRKIKNGKKGKKNGGGLFSAALPFALLALQKKFQRKSGKGSLNKYFNVKN